MRLPRCVIFDWDGTLVDSIEAIVLGFRLVYDEIGRSELSDEQIRATIGLPLVEAFARLTPDLPPQQLTERYRRYWFDPARPPSPWRDGALFALDWLAQRGVRLAVATGKSRQGLEHEWNVLSARPFFHASRAAEETLPKPHPEMVHQLLTDLQVEPSQALVVGDSPWDLAMGRAAGTLTLGLTGGAGSHAQLWQESPSAVLESLQDLPGLFHDGSRKG